MKRQKHRGASVAILVMSLATVAAIVVLSGLSSAQVVGATLSGLISDTSGAAISAATVTSKNLATGEIRSVVTNAEGFYSMPNLLPGSYDVAVTANQFSQAVRKGIVLTVGAQQALNISLKPGRVTEVVEVLSTPPDVQTASSAVSSTVDSRTVRELPLNGRDW